MHFTLGVALLDPGQIKGMQILSNLTHLKQKNPFVLGHTAAAHRAASLQHSAAQPAIQPSSWQAPYLSLAPILMKKAFSE